MVARATLIYLVTIVIVRLGEKRIFGRNNAVDIVLGVTLGSVMSRAINGSTTLSPTIAAGVGLVVLHSIYCRVAIMSVLLGTLMKGRPRLLVKDGTLLPDALRHSHIGLRDLQEAARVEGHISDSSEIKEAWLERNGEISVIPARKPQIIEIKVEAGVQTVRVELR